MNELKPGMLLRRWSVTSMRYPDVPYDEVFLLLRPLTVLEAWSSERTKAGGWLVLAGEETLRLSDYFLSSFCEEINGT